MDNQTVRYGPTRSVKATSDWQMGGKFAGPGETRTGNENRPLARSVGFECFGGWQPILAPRFERLEPIPEEQPRRLDFTQALLRGRDA